MSSEFFPNCKLGKGLLSHEIAEISNISEIFWPHFVVFIIKSNKKFMRKADRKTFVMPLIQDKIRIKLNKSLAKQKITKLRNGVKSSKIYNYLSY